MGCLGIPFLYLRKDFQTLNVRSLLILSTHVYHLLGQQKKLEAELQTIDEKHEAKKRKFQEASDSFHEELKNVSVLICGFFVCFFVLKM